MTHQVQGKKFFKPHNLFFDGRKEMILSYQTKSDGQKFDVSSAHADWLLEVYQSTYDETIISIVPNKFLYFQ